MAANKRTKIERERDLIIITQMWLEKYSQLDIPELLQRETGAEYLLTQQQISYDLKCVMQRMKDETADQVVSHRNRILAEIDNLKRRYWREFRSASSDLEKKDALKGIQWCVERESKILGVENEGFVTPQQLGDVLIIMPEEVIKERKKK